MKSLYSDASMTPRNVSQAAQAILFTSSRFGFIGHASPLGKVRMRGSGRRLPCGSTGGGRLGPEGVCAPSGSLRDLPNSQIEEPRPQLAEAIRQLPLLPREAGKIGELHLAWEVGKLDVQVLDRLAPHLRHVGADRRLTQDCLGSGRHQHRDQKLGYDTDRLDAQHPKRRERRRPESWPT